MTSKTCFKCGTEKPLFDFYKHSRMSDGHLNKCKQCTKLDAKNTREKNIEHYRQYDRDRAKKPDRIQRAAAIQKAWKLAHPERRLANVMLGYAVKSGRVSPWPVCAIPDCSGKPEGHHPDYDRPLDVVWLCPIHHKKAHALMKSLMPKETT